MFAIRNMWLLFPQDRNSAFRACLFAWNASSILHHYKVTNPQPLLWERHRLLGKSNGFHAWLRWIACKFSVLICFQVKRKNAIYVCDYACFDVVSSLKVSHAFAESHLDVLFPPSLKWRASSLMLFHCILISSIITLLFPKYLIHACDVTL